VIPARLAALRVNHALSAAAAAFGLVAIWPWLVPPIPAVRPIVATQAGAPGPSLLALSPLASYAAVVGRPLFTPSRRAPPGAAISALESFNGRYRLIGIVGTAAKRRAFIAEGNRHSEIVEGDLLDGWTVKQIAQDRVLLTSPAGEAVMKLSRGTPEPAKAQ
jgi:hypothetical protein